MMFLARSWTFSPVIHCFVIRGPEMYCIFEVWSYHRHKVNITFRHLTFEVSRCKAELCIVFVISLFTLACMFSVTADGGSVIWFLPAEASHACCEWEQNFWTQSLWLVMIEGYLPLFRLLDNLIKVLLDGFAIDRREGLTKHFDVTSKFR